MRVELLDTVCVRGGPGDVAAAPVTPSGRRARLLLAALALADGSVTADRLADVLWPGAVPPTWPAGLRGVVRGLRSSLAPLGGDDQHVIATVPGGYRLAPGVVVDVRADHDAVRLAESYAGAGRHRAVRQAVEHVTRRRGTDLLAGEDAEWLTTHRADVDETALRAAELMVDACIATADHRDAVDTARAAVAAHPFDERAHRLLIVALDRAGDRAGAVRAYDRCRNILADELGVDPGADTVTAYLHAVQDTGSTVARLPVPASSFVGREPESAALTALLAEPGLVTVVGLGGVGKSRLALQVLAGLEYAGGRHWVSLAAVADDELVSAAVALQLGTDVGSGDPAEQLGARLAPAGRSVLVLDGAEAVRDGSASLAAALLAAAPSLTVLVTSRTPLGVDGERLIEVSRWPAPDAHDLDALALDPQMQVLVERVRADGATVQLDVDNAELFAVLCRRCGGLPLALELAAAQLTAMPVGDLVDQLDGADSDTVSSGSVGGELRAVARTSYAALGRDEATVFRRLGVLDGPVGLPLVRAVVAGPDVAPVRVVRIMRELAARGLVGVDRSGPRWTYQQDDDVHRFARELLVEHGTEREIFDRLATAIQALLPDDAARPPGSFADGVTAVVGSVRSLFGAALDGRADVDRCLELAFRLHRYWTATTVSEGRFWLSRLLAAAPAESPWRRHATYALGYLSYWSADTDEALRHLRSAIDLFGDEPDPFAARALIYVAGLLDDMDSSVEALDYVHRAMAAATPFGTDLYVAAAMGIGSIASERGDPAAAGYAADAVARCRADGSADQLAVLLPTAAMICWQVGALDEARAYVVEALPMHAEHRRIARVVLLSVAAGLALGDGDLAAALEYAANADDEASALGVDREQPLIRAVRSRAMLAAGDLAGAADRALAALDVAAAGSVGFPRAICLETAALVGAAGGAASQELRVLLAAAARIRDAGDRPAPFVLREAVEVLRAEVDGRRGRTGGDGPSPVDPLAAARAVLHRLTLAPA